MSVTSLLAVAVNSNMQMPVENSSFPYISGKNFNIIVFYTKQDIRITPEREYTIVNGLHSYTVVQRNPMVPFATEYFVETEFDQLENNKNRSGNSGDEFGFISDEDFG